MATGAEPAQAPGWGLFAQWHDLIDRGDPRFTFSSTVEEVARAAGADGGLDQSRALWNMQRHWTRSTRSGESSISTTSLRRKGVETRVSILPRRVAERRCPLASSHEPDLRLAPVAHPLMVCDRRLVLVGRLHGGQRSGPAPTPGSSGGRSAFYETAVAARPSRRVPRGAGSRRSRRGWSTIALRLVDGATDREIARSLGVSERTVSADVREMRAGWARSRPRHRALRVRADLRRCRSDASRSVSPDARSR